MWVTARDPDGFLKPSWSRPTPVSFLMAPSAGAGCLLSLSLSLSPPKPSLSLSERRELLAGAGAGLTAGLEAGGSLWSLSLALARPPGPPGLTSGRGVKRWGEVTGGGR